MKKCPYCAEEIQDEAIVCRYCGRNLVPQSIGITPQPNSDRAILAKQLSEAEAEIVRLEQAQKENERNLSSAKGNRTAGAAVLLIAILGFLFFFNWWGLWVFLGIIGALTLFTAMSKQSSAENGIRSITNEMTKARAKVSELRTQLLV